MKTTNQFRSNKNSVLLFSIALLFFPFITKAQINVDAGGNVGVSTSAPSAKLEVLTANSAATNLATKFTNPNTNQAGAQILIGPYSDNYMSSISATGYPYSTYATDLWLRPRKSDASLGNGIYIAPTDNVGIGTSTPTSAAGTALTIKGGAGDNRGGVELRNPSPNLGGSTLGNIRFFNATNEGAVLQVNTGTTATAGQFRFYIRDAAGSNAERIRITEDGNVGIGTLVPGTNKLSVVGNIFATGIINNSSGTFGPSDVNLKENIDSSFIGMAILKQLKPVTFDFKTAQYPRMNLPVGSQYGLIAQEVEQILPNFVINATLEATVADTNGNIAQPALEFKALNYTELIPILLKGIQELNSVIENQQAIAENTSNTQDATTEALNSKINDLQSQIYSCCNLAPQETGAISDSNKQQKNVTGNSISDSQNSATSVLFQNVPNPFNQQTNIEYFIPANAQSASIMVFDLNGKLINTFPIRVFGKDAISINGSQLNPGMFVYSLIVDEKIIDTKRMILTH